LRGWAMSPVSELQRVRTGFIIYVYAGKLGLHSLTPRVHHLRYHLHTMSNPAIIRMPQELIDKFIDNVYWNERYIYTQSDDILLWTSHNILQVSERYDLLTCSLISKAWLPRSRYYLFYHVVLSDLAYSSFLKLLDSRRGTVAPYVRRLELCRGLFRRKWPGRRINKLLRLLKSLKAVEFLRVHLGWFDRLDRIMTARISPIFRTLKHLEIDGCVFSSTPQLLDILSAASQVERLVLKSVSVRSSSESNPIRAVFKRVKCLAHTAGLAPSYSASCRAPSHLRTLALSRCDPAKEILMWLQSGGHPPPINTLNLNIANMDDVPACFEFICTIFSSLEDLRVNFTNDIGGFNFVATGMRSPHSSLHIRD